MTEVDEMIQEKYAGAMNAGRPLILNHGMKYESITMNPEDAQMLESRAFSVEEICRFFGVPPFMIGSTQKSTVWGTGLEQQTLGFQKFTLRRRFKRIEMALEKQLLTAADRARGVTIEFNLDGLLRGDSAGARQVLPDRNPQRILHDQRSPGVGEPAAGRGRRRGAHPNAKQPTGSRTADRLDRAQPARRPFDEESDDENAA